MNKLLKEIIIIPIQPSKIKYTNWALVLEYSILYWNKRWNEDVHLIIKFVIQLGQDTRSRRWHKLLFQSKIWLQSTQLCHILVDLDKIKKVSFHSIQFWRKGIHEVFIWTKRQSFPSKSNLKTSVCFALVGNPVETEGFMNLKQFKVKSRKKMFR